MNSRQFLVFCAICITSLFSKALPFRATADPSAPWSAGDDRVALRSGKVLFYGHRRGESHKNDHVYSFDLATSTMTRLLDDQTEQQLIKIGCQYLDATADGRWLVLTTFAPEVGLGAEKMLLVDAQTRTARVLVSNGRSIIFPRFSPDGTEIVFYHCDPDMYRSAMEIYTDKGFALSVVNVATGAIRQLAPEDWRLMRDGPPSWSPDGTRVAFSGLYKMGEPCGLFLVASKGGERRRISPDDVTMCCRPVWIDNETLLYTGSQRGPGLFRIKADGTGNRLIYRGSLHRVPDLSPDGKRVCFQAFEMEIDHMERPHLIVLDLSTGQRLTAPPGEIIRDRWRR